MISRNIVFFACLLLCVLVCFDVGNSDPLVYTCPNDTLYNTNSTSGRTYRNNLDSLLSALTSNASQPNGFYNLTAGSVDTAVYGLFLCRGDVKTSDCQDCLTTARSEVLRYCPFVKRAIIWYDNCMLRYSNESIFSRMDTSIGWFLWNNQNATDTGTGFLDPILRNTFDQIEFIAANDSSGKKFAVQQAYLFQRMIYALGQCTPDLSSLDCGSCLRNAISNLPRCCSNRQGGRVIYPSCNIRYETYPFYQVPTPPPPAPESSPDILPPPPPPPLPGPVSSKGKPTTFRVCSFYTQYTFCES